MKKLLVAPIIVATLGASSFALAGGPDDMSQPAANYGEVTMGADLGYSWADAPANQTYWNQGILSPFNQFKNKTTGGFAWGGHVGYRYEVMPALRIGIEGGYLNLAKTENDGTGSPEGTPGDIDTYNYTIKDQVATLLATADYRFFDHYDVFAKFGPALVWQKSVFNYYDLAGTVQNSDLSTSKRIHAIKPFLSVGVGYNIHNFEISVAYDRLFGAATSSKDVVEKDRPGAAVGGFSDIKKRVYSQNVVLGSIGYSLPV